MTDLISIITTAVLAASPIQSSEELISAVDEVAPLAYAVYLEAGNQPYECMVGVSEVVITRAVERDHDMRGQVAASGAYTSGPTHAKVLAKMQGSALEPPAFTLAAKAAAVTFTHQEKTVTGGANMFHDTSLNNAPMTWAGAKETWRCGDLVFYYNPGRVMRHNYVPKED